MGVEHNWIIGHWQLLRPSETSRNLNVMRESVLSALIHHHQIDCGHKNLGKTVWKFLRRAGNCFLQLVKRYRPSSSSLQNNVFSKLHTSVPTYTFTESCQMLLCSFRQSKALEIEGVRREDPRFLSVLGHSRKFTHSIHKRKKYKLNSRSEGRFLVWKSAGPLPTR